MPGFDVILDFHEEFGGVGYSIRGSGDEIVFGLVHTVRGEKHIEMVVDEAGLCNFECAEHESAPFTFFLRQTGEVCIADRSLLPVSSSVLSYIESDAMLAESHNLYPNWISFSLGLVHPQDRRIDAAIDAVGVPLIEEASDEFTRWWRTDSVFLCRKVYWDTSERRDSVFGAGCERHATAELLARLKVV